LLKAITRAVSRNISRCELTYVRRECVDYERAVRQHAAYRELLERSGARVLELDACDENPDCCFVADTAVVLDELAVVASMGAPSRRAEVAAVEELISSLRPVKRISLPATLDGGDVLRVGRRLFVGRSGRTNRAGVEALASLVAPFGYEVTPVAVRGSLHLTTAASALDEETVLVNPRWIDAAPFARQWVLEVPEEEPWAASTVRVGATVCVEAGAPRTLELVGRHCPDVEVLDISEFRKAEGSLPCLSILFNGDDGQTIPHQQVGQSKEGTA
jgi:dimethylargininase